MPWGKFKGVPLDEIDTDYLVWVKDVAEATRPGLRLDVEAELARRRRAHEPPPPPPRSRIRPCPDPAVAAAIVAAGLKVLARKHHPDLAGGDVQVMQTVNATADWLRSQVPQ
jgi:hypothetical protein